MSEQASGPVDAQRSEQARMQARAGNGQFTGQARRDPLDVPYYDPEHQAILLDGGSVRSGTYDFPPVPQNQSDLVNFWMTVDIPDAALDAAMRAHARRFEIVAERARQSYVSRFPRPTGAMGEAEMAKWRKGLQDEVAGWIRDNPTTKGMASTMPRAQVRAIVRAAQMWHQASQWLPKEDQDIIAGLRVRLPIARHDTNDKTPAYEDTTVGLIARKWRTWEIIESFHDRGSRDLERLVNQTA